MRRTRAICIAARPLHCSGCFPAIRPMCIWCRTDDGKWLRRLSKPVFGPHTYPNVGVWPRDGFWRKAGGQVIVGRCPAARRVLCRPQELARLSVLHARR